MPPLFTPRFLLMCGFSFTVFVSAFQLFPTVPFRIRDLGGGSLLAGLYLGLFTYASALSAPLTGAIGDRVGHRRTLVVAAGAIVLCSVAYGLTRTAVPLLVIAVVHGVFWSGLLSASAAIVAGLIPESRRTEGLAYYGMAPVLSIAVAPWIGLKVYDHGWAALCISVALMNLLMMGLGAGVVEAKARPAAAGQSRLAVDWRSLVVAVTMFLPAFGHGGVTSFVALYAEANHVSPPSLFFSVSATTILLTRPIVGRVADRVGHKAVLLPSLALASLGYGLLAIGGTTPWMLAAAVTAGLGFGTVYPVLAALLLFRAAPERRGAAFGGLLAMLDVGIGSGSIVVGYVVARAGYGPAFTIAAVLAALAAPYFLAVTRAAGRASPGPTPPGARVPPQ